MNSSLKFDSGHLTARLVSRCLGGFYCINFTPLNRVCESFKSLLGQMKRRLHIWEPSCWLSYLLSRLTTRLRTQTLFWTVSRVTSACRTFRAWEREDELKIWKFRCEGSQRGRCMTHRSADDLLWRHDGHKQNRKFTFKSDQIKNTRRRKQTVIFFCVVTRRRDIFISKL